MIDARSNSIASAPIYGIIASELCKEDSIKGLNKEFKEWIIEEAILNRERKEEDSYPEEFWNIVAILYSKKILNSHHIILEEDKLYLWMKAIYHEFEKDYKQRKGESPLTYRSLLDQIQPNQYSKLV